MSLPTWRLYFSRIQIGMIMTFSGIILLAYLDSDDWMTPFLICNLILAVIINVFRALFRAANRCVIYLSFICNAENISTNDRNLFPLRLDFPLFLLDTVFCDASSNMGKFPVIYMGSLSNGVCMGGLVPVMVNILILSMDVNHQMAGFSCFVFSAIVSVLCLILFLNMEKAEFYQFYSSVKTGL